MGYIMSHIRARKQQCITMTYCASNSHSNPLSRLSPYYPIILHATTMPTVGTAAGSKARAAAAKSTAATLSAANSAELVEDPTYSI